MILENRPYSILDISKISLKCAPVSSTITALQKLLDGIIPTLQLVVTASFINTAADVTAGRGGKLNIEADGDLFKAVVEFYS